MAPKPSLVLLSGIASDEDTWAEQLATLREVAHCLPLIAQGSNVDAMADDVLRRVPGKFALAGHSMGGYVALGVQRRAPGRVSRLALICTSAAPDGGWQREGRMATLATLKRDGYEAVITRLLAMVLADGGHPRLLERIEAQLRRAGPERFAREQRAAMDRPDARPALTGIRVPTLVIGGAADRIVPPEGSVELAALVSHAALVLLDGVGHSAPIEAPERVGALLGEWLERE